jgi:CRP/FNR family transcriptional regulator
MSLPSSEFRKAVILKALRSCQLFGGLSPADLQSVTELVALRPLAKGEYLFHEGSQSQGFFLVQAGAINVHRVTATGKEQSIHVFRTGESFAEASLATDEGYPADARAMEASQVLLIQKAGFVDLLRRNPELALRMLAAMSLHLRLLVGQIEAMTLRDVETRLTHWLVRRCPNPAAHGHCRVELGISKRELAAELGTVGETLSRTLSKFRARGLITVKGREIIVIDPAALQSILRQNLGEYESPQ